MGANTTTCAVPSTHARHWLVHLSHIWHGMWTVHPSPLLLPFFG